MDDSQIKDRTQSPSGVYRHDPTKKKGEQIQLVEPHKPFLSQRELIIFLLLLATCGFLYFQNIAASIKKELALEQQNKATITVIGVEGFPDTIQVRKLLKMYGFNVNFHEKQILQKPGMSKDDVLKLSEPDIILANGKKISKDNLYKYITSLKLISFNPDHQERDPGQVILYGVNNCPYTLQAKEMLENKKIPYTYVDLNTNAAVYMGEIGAKLLVSGYNYHQRVDQPMLEYNNTMHARPTIYNYIESIQSP